MRKLSKSISALALLVIASEAASQEQSIVPNATPIIVETFEGDDSSLMLGGQIDFNTKKSPWITYVADGKLVLENRDNPNSLHYNDIAWVKYPDSSALTSTENSVMSVVVESQSVGRGGAGILVGSGKRGSYLIFAVDEESRYHVFKKENRTTRPVHSAKHPAILVNAPNELAFRVSGANVVFFANGTEIIQVPNTVKNARLVDGQSGIGIGAFGTGTFSFETVEISQAN